MRVVLIRRYKLIARLRLGDGLKLVDDVITYKDSRTMSVIIVDSKKSSFAEFAIAEGLSPV
jgi:hypothetical protein